MDPIGWIKTNLILILLVLLGITFAFGSITSLWLKHELKVARADLVTSQVNFGVCKSSNDAWTQSNATQTAAIQANAQLAKDSQANAIIIQESAALISGPIRNAAASLRAFKPSAAAIDDCAKARESVDAYYRAKQTGGKP